MQTSIPELKLASRQLIIASVCEQREGEAQAFRRIWPDRKIGFQAVKTQTTEVDNAIDLLHPGNLAVFHLLWEGPSSWNGHFLGQLETSTTDNILFDWTQAPADFGQ